MIITSRCTIPLALIVLLSRTAWSAETPPVKITLTVHGLVVVLCPIPTGVFTMGSPTFESGRDNEETAHQVTITKPFYCSEIEVTQDLYQMVTGKNPSRQKGPRRPVEQISWNDAVSFCKKLSQLTGRTLRLPTEAEWEYACRASSTGPFHFGGDCSGRAANFDGNFPYGRGEKVAPLKKTTEAKQYPPNIWGLYDMHGNVWEWCSDWYGDYGAAEQDPAGPKNGAYRVVRGGSYGDKAVTCRSAARGWQDADYGDAYIGFRFVMETAAPPK